MTKFEKAKKRIAEIISHSEEKTDSRHSLNTLEWLLKLQPNADEILQLAALAHDIERASSDRLRLRMFKTYDEYKSAHALRGAEIAKKLVKDIGYSDEEAGRIFEMIKYHEVGNGDPEVDVIRDADSISYFDVGIEEYLKRAGEDVTRNKIKFMRERASENVKIIIDEIIRNKPELSKLFF